VNLLEKLVADKPPEPDRAGRISIRSKDSIHRMWRVWIAIVRDSDYLEIIGNLAAQRFNRLHGFPLLACPLGKNAEPDTADCQQDE
jgi:hypothetical protein